MDRATQGQPGKYTFCCAENEAVNPWEPLHVERGFARDCSTVTVVGAAGTVNMNTHAKDAGTHSVYVPAFGGISRSVTREVSL